MHLQHVDTADRMLGTVYENVPLLHISEGGVKLHSELHGDTPVLTRRGRLGAPREDAFANAPKALPTHAVV